MLQSVPVQFSGSKKMDTRVEINTWTTTKTIVAGMELLASKSQHQFDAQQLKALKYVCQVCQGENVFINGIGGTGKSTVLKEIMSEHGLVCPWNDRYTNRHHCLWSAVQHRQLSHQVVSDVPR